MASGFYRFEHFRLHPQNRQLFRHDQSIEINARYFDALALLLRAQGKLVSKEQFFTDVWQGLPVTDEALTQCIKTLRKLLDDSASRPHFIETVPKYGYRFIAPAQWVEDNAGIAKTPNAMPEPATPIPASASEYRARVLALVIAGTAGGAVAGLSGGLLLGLIVSGSLSALLVMLCLCVAIAIIGAAGVALGVVAAARVAGASLSSHISGGALGGMLIGAAGKLIGMDAFNLLIGQSPGEITGAPEGFLIGAVIGASLWYCTEYVSNARRVWTVSLLAGSAAGLLIMLTGGQLMSRSLHALIQNFPESRLRLDAIGALFGENGFGTLSQLAIGTLEAALFAGFVVLFMWLSDKQNNLER